MGVYYTAINTTKREVIEPHGPSKEWAIKGSCWCWPGHAFQAALATALATGWQGDNVGVYGDSSSSGEYDTACDEGYKDVTDEYWPDGFASPDEADETLEYNRAEMTLYRAYMKVWMSRMPGRRTILKVLRWGGIR